MFIQVVVPFFFAKDLDILRNIVFLRRFSIRHRVMGMPTGNPNVFRQSREIPK
jgi:hypothetical protein